MTFDARDPGTPAAAWDAVGIRRTRDLDLGGVRALVVVAAHPDDETLGAGGLIAAARHRGLPVHVVVVTDGGDRGRSAELRAALDELGTAIGIVELGFPDGGVRERRAEVAAALAEALVADPDALLVAPWPGDGHRDHRVVGEIVADLADGRRMLGYPIWAWHWGDPARPAFPVERLVGLGIDLDRKRRAIGRFRSQISGPLPMLHEGTLAHFARDREVFVT